MSFGDTLRQLRTSRGYTQMKLADALGCSQTAIASWENETREPDFVTIQKIADFFSVPMTTFFTYSEASTEDYARIIADIFRQKPKLRLIFDKVQLFSDEELDAIISLVNILSKEHMNS